MPLASASFVGTTGLLDTAVADLMSGVINRHTGLNLISPGLCALDNTAVQWLCDIVGLENTAKSSGVTSGGILASGGSMAST